MLRGAPVAQEHPRLFLVDNYDSFTFNLVQALEELGAQVTVRRNDAADVRSIREFAPEAIVISPGPCTPDATTDPIHIEARRCLRMSDEQGSQRPDPEDGVRASTPTSSSERPIVGTVVKRTSRFSAEVVATMISLASAAFGVVAALAWNTAITQAFAEAFGKNVAGRLSALFVYAVVVTLIGVIVIVLLGRLAARIRAEPLEFKYPGVPRS